MCKVIIFKINKEDHDIKHNEWFFITKEKLPIYQLIGFDDIHSYDNVITLLKKHNVQFHTITSIGTAIFNEAYGHCDKTGDYIIILPETSDKYQEIARCITIKNIIA